MSDCVIRLVDLPGIGSDIVRGPARYLQKYDPDRCGGRGLIETTSDPSRALRFASAVQARSCWQLQSRTFPIRPDGEPNRPLTAFTIVIERLGQEEVGFVPGHWRNEISGVLKPAVMAYLHTSTPLPYRHVATIRAYLRQFMSGDFRGPMIDVLRSSVEEIGTREDINRWLARAERAGIDPL